MANQIIKKSSKYNFDIFWEGVNNSHIHLNFEPLITQHNLSGKFALLHWQAKPKFYRRWGMYYAPHDWYYPFDWHELLVESRLQLNTLQISEAKFSVVPTAVILLSPVSLTLDMSKEQYRLSVND